MIWLPLPEISSACFIYLLTVAVFSFRHFQLNFYFWIWIIITNLLLDIAAMECAHSRAQYRRQNDGF